MRDDSSSTFALIAKSQQPDSCSRSVSAQLQNDVKKSCTDHAAEHHYHLLVDRDERRNVEVHDLVHLSTPAAYGAEAPETAAAAAAASTAQ